MQMIALGLRQHQAFCDAIKDMGGRRSAASLFQPSIPRRAYIGALGDFLATQAQLHQTLCDAQFAIDGMHFGLRFTPA